MSVLPIWNFVTYPLDCITITAAFHRAVVRYVHDTGAGSKRSRPADTKPRRHRRLFYFHTEKNMSMLRGTRFVVGKDAAQIRNLETRFRSYLH